MSEDGGVAVLKDLEQVRLLAHPLRSRILMAFCHGEFTTKQVAENLKEKATKLYHHVEMLEKAGLIRKTRTRQNRGTLEQYYKAIAQSFQVDPELFSAGDKNNPADSGLQETLRSIFDSTGREMAEMFPTMAAMEENSETVLGHLAISAEQEHIDELRRRIDAVADYIKELSEVTGGDETKTNRCFRLTLAFYPLENPGKKSK